MNLATSLLEGITLHQDGSVIVDEYMRAADGVYAAGDIACFPDPRTGARQCIEHFRTAMQQGRVAAHNMSGKEVSYDGVPFFWTRQFDVALLDVGHAKQWDEIIYQGDVSSRDFFAFFVKGEPGAGGRRNESRSGDGRDRRTHETPSNAAA